MNFFWNTINRKIKSNPKSNISPECFAAYYHNQMSEGPLSSFTSDQIDIEREVHDYYARSDK